MRKQISFTSVKKLKEFVLSEAKRIESRPFTVRSIRQLTDARRFLDMLDRPQYASIQNVSELKAKISEVRKELQDINAAFDKFLPGYQMSVFEDTDATTEEQRKFIRAQKVLIEEEIHWLHKCLGICHNREYFR